MEKYFYERMYPINLLGIKTANRRDDLEDIKNCIEMGRFFENKSNSNRTPNILEEHNPEKKYLELYFPNIKSEEIIRIPYKLDKIPKTVSKKLKEHINSKTIIIKSPFKKEVWIINKTNKNTNNKFKIPNFWSRLYHSLPETDKIKKHKSKYYMENYQTFIQFCRYLSIKLNYRFTKVFNFDKYPTYKYPLVELNTFKPINYNKIKFTEEGTYSISSPAEASEISLLIKKYCSGKTITDGTANMGGNVLSFSYLFNDVNAIELNEENFNVMKNNLKQYKRKNINYCLGDSLEIIPTLKQDIIFFDPPWGGKNYKKHKQLNITLGGKTLQELIEIFSKYCSCIVFKLPRNTNLHKIKHKYSKYNIRNYLIIIIDI